MITVADESARSAADAGGRCLVVGAGRLAASLMAYLSAAGVAHVQWRRALGEDQLAQMAQRAERILLAVSDNAIVELAAFARRANPQALVCHFSAVARTPDAGQLHPAAAFPRSALPLELLKAIPFIEIKGELAFADMFPFWSNPVFAIRSEDRALYHALLVLAGNFASLVWNEAAAHLEDDIGVPGGALLAPYIATNLIMLEAAPRSSFSGPVTRGDAKTLRANLAALADYPFLRRCYETMLDEKWPGGAAALANGTG